MIKFISFYFTRCLGVFIFIFLCSHKLSAQILENEVYTSNIKSIQLYPSSNDPKSQLLSPVLALNSNQTLLLSFDELNADAKYYKAKIVHCNADWTKSQLADLEFLKEFNEFDVPDYDYSFNTKTDYVHYQMLLPRPFLPGNYVVIIYPEGEEANPILRRRFLVYDPQVLFSPDETIISSGHFSRYDQQLMFSINYKGVSLTNPESSVTVTILQNHRWDNAKSGIHPSFVKPDQTLLEFKYFTDQTTFKGGNEFRYFDLRSIKFLGQFVDRVQRNKNDVVVWLEPDKNRGNLAYGIEQDIDGGFLIDNVERRNPLLENDYVQVNFLLQTKKLSHDVYVVGAFNQWKLNQDNFLVYDDHQHAYIGQQLLKQGWYDYQYLVDGQNNNLLEGNWNETENQYEFLVYYRPPRLQADLLIGYHQVDYRSH